MIQFATVQDFYQMGGYGVYVWSAYAVALVVLGFSLFKVCRRFRDLQKKLHQKHASST